MRLGIAIVMAAILSVFAASAVFADNPEGTPLGTTSNTEMTNTSTVLSTYPLDVCIVSGEKLTEKGTPTTKMIDGREVRFCCNNCPATFEKNKAKYFKKLDEAIIAKEKPGYPLQSCVVSGDKLENGKMGKPIDYVYNNHLVRLSSKQSLETFKKDPDKYMKVLGEAYASAGGSKDVKSASDMMKKDQN